MKKENAWQEANTRIYAWRYCGERIILRGREIIYVHVEHHKVYVHTRNEVYRVTGTLSAAADQLADLPMVRTHEGYLVHMDYLQKIGNSFAILKNGEKIPVSRRHWKHTKAEIEDYLERKKSVQISGDKNQRPKNETDEDLHKT